MDQKEEKINALLEDNRFVDWVINPTSVYAEYWTGWIEGSVENAALAEEARRFIGAMRDASADTGEITGDFSIDEGWDHIHKSMVDEPGLVRRSFFRRRQWAVAAIATGLIVLAGWLLIKQNESGHFFAHKERQDGSSPELVRYNESDKNELFFLPDGSKVILARGARISYNRLMSGAKRDVTLSGEAFFDVAKNPKKPFYIYTEKMVVKVLGTSFRVITSAQQEAVFVKSGKVSVYLKGQEQGELAAKVISPRQACTYSSPAKGLIRKPCTASDMIGLDTDSQEEYVFEDASVDSVFKTLEKMYDLPILYDRATFENCFINISLGDERLEDKLEVITQTINASFSLSNKGIVIEGKGCK